MKPIIWIIDDEWADYKIEEKLLYSEFPDCTIKYSDLDFEKDLETFGTDVDAVICQISVDMNKEVISKLDKCKIISVYGTGYNNVDIEAAKEKGINVGFIPGYCAEDIGDYVIGAIYYINKGYGTYNKAIQSGLWGAQAVTKTINRLSSKKLLIFGYGRIGQVVGKKAKANNIEVLACDPFLSEERAKELGVKMVSLEEGLKQADFVSIHCIYSKETKGLFGKDQFKMMKNDAYLINSSRGPIVNQKELIEAVKNNDIAGAVLDVLEQEPPEKNDEILQTDGIIVTPHMSYYSIDALNELQYRAASNVVKVLCGKDGADLVK